MLCSSFFWWPARVMPRVGRSLVGNEGIKSGPASPTSQAPTPRPTSPCLLLAELSHITQGAEVKPREIVLVALQSNG